MRATSLSFSRRVAGTLSRLSFDTHRRALRCFVVSKARVKKLVEHMMFGNVLDEIQALRKKLVKSQRARHKKRMQKLNRRIRKATEETIQIQKQHAEDKVNWERKLEQLRREEACYLTMIQFADDKREMRARMAQKEAEEETQHKIQCIALMEQYVRAKYNISSVQPSMLLA